ncbi:MAG: PEGA domain-containing protein [Deltaproteobacteria bacterium]|nr:PEGA domain-containing protein [Deltaproteobacteria bacterium]
MSRIPGCLALASLLPALAAAQPAAEPEAETDAAREQAAQHFQSGVSLMQNDNWEAALLEFERSLELFPTRNALFNLGMCQKALFRYVVATRTFERFLELYREVPEAAPQIQAVNDAMQELRGLRASISVDVNVAGAEIRIDDQPVGSAPLIDPIAVDPGRRTVEARLDGYGGAPQIVTVTSGETVAVHVVLTEIARIGRVRVEANVPGAEVWVDDALLGAVPYRGDLAEGEHTIEVRAPGYETQTQTVAVATGDERIVTVSLARPGGADPAWFWSMVGVTSAATVATAALGAVVIVKDQDYSQNPTQDALDEGDRLMLATDICLGVAVAAAVAGVVLAFTTNWSDEETPDEEPGVEVTPTVGASGDGAGLFLLGRF